MKTSPATPTSRLPGEIERRKRVIWGELKERVFWFIRLRWWVPPAIAVAALAGVLIRADFSLGPVLAVAAFILAYNAAFYVLGQTLEVDDAHRGRIERFTYYQVVFDYASMFMLIHFTGGAASPLIFFFIFHIIFASILLPARMAYAFAALVAVGMAGISAAEYLGVLAHHPILYQGQGIDLARQPYHMFIELCFFSASLFITTFSTTGVVSMLRRRIVALADLSEAINRANDKLGALYYMTQTILSERRLPEVLNTVTTDLAQVMEVRGISVKLLANNGRELRYEASHGLPDRLTRENFIEVDKSPLNRRIIEGEPFVTGRLSERESFQFGEDLTEAGIQSVLFAPLKVEDRVIGILGAYCKKPDRFGDEEVEFFRLAAGLVALAVENARAYEAIEGLIQERSRFMRRVAHNLRAPLAAVVSMIEVLREGHLGDFNPEQTERLRRVDRRVRTMLEMINELLTLARGKTGERTMETKAIDPEWLAGRIERTFIDKAAEKEIRLTIEMADEVQPFQGDPGLIEQVLENLVSNAVKYNHRGGKVEVTFGRGKGDTVQIEVRDDGIGIPKEQMPRLFTEFFRADNAKQMEEVGTGLGLSIVKDIVERHGGRIIAESTEGLGAIFVVCLPTAGPAQPPDSFRPKE